MMPLDELVEALRRVSLPGAYRCLWCKYEDDCNSKGCVLIRSALEQLMVDDAQIRMLSLAVDPLVPKGDETDG